MKKCIMCKNYAVDRLSIGEEIKRIVNEFLPHRLHGAVFTGKVLGRAASVFTGSSENYVCGTVMKCKFCGSYYVECHHCDEISYVHKRPSSLDKVKCQHCFKTMVIDDNEDGINPGLLY